MNRAIWLQHRINKKIPITIPLSRSLWFISFVFICCMSNASKTNLKLIIDTNEINDFIFLHLNQFSWNNKWKNPKNFDFFISLIQLITSYNLSSIANDFWKSFLTFLRSTLNSYCMFSKTVSINELAIFWYGKTCVNRNLSKPATGFAAVGLKEGVLWNVLLDHRT